MFLSSSHLSVKQLAVIGGNLNAELAENVLRKQGGEELQLLCLHTNGKVCINVRHLVYSQTCLSPPVNSGHLLHSLKPHPPPREKEYTWAPGDFAPEMPKKRALENQKSP